LGISNQESVGSSRIKRNKDNTMGMDVAVAKGRRPEKEIRDQRLDISRQEKKCCGVRASEPIRTSLGWRTLKIIGLVGYKSWPI
jgi:hypothetical protein